MTRQQWRIALRANLLGERDVVGTYHSHPLSPAEPGDADIAGASSGELMLIIACWDRNFGLWHIRKGKARKMILCKRRG